MPSVDQAAAWYREDDPVHGFDHILRVLDLAERLAIAEGADLEIVRAAVLLHDAKGGDATQGERSQHQQLSAEFAREILAAETWPPERIAAVQHCIRAHRFRGDEQPNTLEAQIVFDADKLDVIGAFGVARTIAYAVEVGQPVFAEPSDLFMQDSQKVPGEYHSAYHEYLFKLKGVIERLHTESAKTLAKARHDFMVGFFEQLSAEARGER
ncbi:MAG: HD domain-containing protein [Chloroflexi bacterium]|nr:HD domain-containing protein [Chloroflexota bacterium]